MSITLALLPDFLLMLVGCVFRRRLSLDGWKAIDALNFHLLFPALIFSAAARSSVVPKDLAVIGVGTWAIMAVGCGLAFLARPLGPARFIDFAGLWQTAWRFNAAIALVAAQALPEAPRALMAIAIGCAVPVANVMAVTALSHGNAFGLRQTVRQVISNPFLLASVAGLVVSIGDLPLPGLVLDAVHGLAAAAIPVALLSIGATLNLRALAALDAFLGILNAVKLMALPALTMVAAWLAGLSPDHSATLVLFAALPTASAAHVLASVFGADRTVVATVIAQSTLLCCLTLPYWLSMLT